MAIRLGSATSIVGCLRSVILHNKLQDDALLLFEQQLGRRLIDNVCGASRSKWPIRCDNGWSATAWLGLSRLGGTLELPVFAMGGVPVGRSCDSQAAP